MAQSGGGCMFVRQKEQPIKLYRKMNAESGDRKYTNSIVWKHIANELLTDFRII